MARPEIADVTVPELRFLMPQEEALAAFLQQTVVQDMAGAQLSRTFRAYYRIRPFLPLAVRQWLQRKRNVPVATEGRWYIPEALEQHLEAHPLTSNPWPAGKAYALVLSHDVETAAGMNAILPLADVEQQLGFRSSWNLVPHKYPIDQGIVRELQARGHEVGVHGYNHDGCLFLSRRRFQRRVPAINDAIVRYQADGFRAPMVHRNLAWLQELRVQYDASCFDIDPYQAMPGGVQAIWPFACGHFIELPYTLPQDHTLLIAMGETSNRIWLEKLAWLKRYHGMALLLTHPDYLDTPERLAIYRETLESVREHADYQHWLPKEIAAWTRRQIDGTTGGTPQRWAGNAKAT